MDNTTDKEMILGAVQMDSLAHEKNATEENLSLDGIAAETESAELPEAALEKLNFHDYLFIKCYETITKAKKTQGIIFSKISRVKELIDACSPAVKNIDEVSNLIEGACKYMELMDRLAAEIGLDTKSLIENLKLAMQNLESNVVDLNDLNNSCNVTLAKTVQLQDSIEKSLKEVTKSINVSFSRYEHMFQKYKSIYAIFEQQSQL